MPRGKLSFLNRSGTKSLKSYVRGSIETTEQKRERYGRASGGSKATLDSAFSKATLDSSEGAGTRQRQSAEAADSVSREPSGRRQKQARYAKSSQETLTSSFGAGSERRKGYAGASAESQSSMLGASAESQSSMLSSDQSQPQSMLSSDQSLGHETRKGYARRAQESRTSFDLPMGSQLSANTGVSVVECGSVNESQVEAGTLRSRVDPSEADVHFDSVPDVRSVSETEDDSATTEMVEQDEIPIGIDPNDWNVMVAAGKAYSILDRWENVQLTVDRSSVYGAALVMPQLARSAEGSRSFSALAIRSYMMLCANLVMQGFLLYMISKSERILGKYNGRMRICDFGAQIDSCPDAPNCWGPGGTRLSPDRMFSWSAWRARVFLKDALMELFPEKIDDINLKVDPGEFGVQSYSLRIITCFLFIMGLYGDLASTLEMAWLLWKVPSSADSWMEYEIPDGALKAAREPGWRELDYLRFKLAGMPLHWKIINTVMVWLPKMYIWILMVEVGIVFLMETAAIEDMIINSATLAFILNIDELIFANIMPEMACYVMENIEDYVTEEIEVETYWSKDAVAKYEEDLNWSIFSKDFFMRIFPIRLALILVITLVFIAKYYFEGCHTLPGGSVVGNDVYTPMDDSLDIMTFLLSPVGLMHIPVNKAALLWSFGQQ